MALTQIINMVRKKILSPWDATICQYLIGITILIGMGRFFVTIIDVDYCYHIVTYIPIQHWSVCVKCSCSLSPTNCQICGNGLWCEGGTLSFGSLKSAFGMDFIHHIHGVPRKGKEKGMSLCAHIHDCVIWRGGGMGSLMLTFNRWTLFNS